MRSDTIKSGFQRAPHRGLLHACGVKPEDVNKPFIAVANSFCEIVPGHVHLNKVAETVKGAIREAGPHPQPGVSDRGRSQGNGGASSECSLHQL